MATKYKNTPMDTKRHWYRSTDELPDPIPRSPGRRGPGKRHREYVHYEYESGTARHNKAP